MKKLSQPIRGYFWVLLDYVEWLHIPTCTVSCPVTTRTVSKKFPGNFLKFPKKLRALLLLAHFRKGNFFDSWKFPEPALSTDCTVCKG